MCEVALDVEIRGGGLLYVCLRSGREGPEARRDVPAFYRAVVSCCADLGFRGTSAACEDDGTDDI